uniref:Cyclin-dependent kinases regulatory subunit n=1 Tax=Equus caballus TaxID=9796 RepID=A0A3Q2L7D9_HORSE
MVGAAVQSAAGCRIQTALVGPAVGLSQSSRCLGRTSTCGLLPRFSRPVSRAAPRRAPPAGWPTNRSTTRTSTSTNTTSTAPRRQAGQRLMSRGARKGRLQRQTPPAVTLGWHVMLPRELSKQVPKTHLMSEEEWRRLGVQQSLGWVHYMIHEPEPHILLFRRPLPKDQQK